MPAEKSSGRTETRRKKRDAKLLGAAETQSKTKRTKPPKTGTAASKSQETRVDVYYDYAVKKGWILPASQARSRDMCERILEAANRVFARQGYEATKISDIASAAGCSVGIFYKRFSDKESLFYALQYRHLEGGRRRLDRLVDAVDSNLSTQEVLYRYVRASVRYMLDDAGFERALVEMSLKNRRVWKAQQAHHKYAGDRLIDFLIARGELPGAGEDSRVRGHFAARIVFGTVINLLAVGPGPYEASDPRVVDSLADILRGFLHEEQERLRLGSNS